VTKEIPKEMLPVFAKGSFGQVFLKPMLQLVFEHLYDAGFRKFCFIVGRGKRAIEDHFNRDPSFVSYLVNKGKHEYAEELKAFYRKVEDSTIVFVNQPEPKGFGDAIYRAKTFIGDKPFLVHAGDDIILSEGNSHCRRLIKVFEEMNADATFLVERVSNPQRYGVITGIEIRPRIYKVTNIFEKPKIPPSNIATVATYVFNEKIFEAIKQTKPDANGEVQLTDAIRHLILNGNSVYAIELLTNEKRIDVGIPESYWNALKYTFEWCFK
jgi:UTP--glucose-1-phosphate uridylyltransferase